MLKQVEVAIEVSTGVIVVTKATEAVSLLAKAAVAELFMAKPASAKSTSTAMAVMTLEVYYRYLPLYGEASLTDEEVPIEVERRAELELNLLDP